MAILRRGKDRRGVKTWQLVAANPKACHIAGNSAMGFLNLPTAGRLPQRTAARLADLYLNVVESHRSHFIGHLRDDKNSASKLALVASAHPFGTDCVAILFEDVSVLNQTTRKLFETLSLLAQMCDAAQVIVWRAEPGTLKFTSVTKEARQILGYWIERWCNENDFWHRHTYPSDWRAVREACARVAAGEGEQRIDCRMIHADGSTRWFRFHVKKVTSAMGTDELAGVMVDVTDHKLVESAARRLSAEIIKAQEEERRRISRDLHDGIGQYLAGLKCNMRALLGENSCTPAMRQKLHECLETLGICINETRSISQMLHPPILDLLGLAPALRSHAEDFTRRTGIRVELDLPLANERFDPEVETSLFRIAQECLTNIQRHARTDFARVRLARDSDDVVMDIEDHGIGMDPALLKKLPPHNGNRGIGLLKMKERVSELNGTLSIHSNGSGAKVRVQVPRQPPPIDIRSSNEPEIAAARGSSS